MAKEICPHAEGGCVLAFGPWCFTCYEGIGIESKKAQSERIRNQYNTGDKNCRTNLIWWRVRVNHLQIISLDRRYFLTCEWCCMGTCTLIKSLYFTIERPWRKRWKPVKLSPSHALKNLPISWLQKSQVQIISDHSRPFSCGDSVASWERPRAWELVELAGSWAALAALAARVWDQTLLWDRGSFYFVPFCPTSD